MPRELFRYIWQISGRAQLWLSLLSVIVFLLTLAPLELQRRIVNGAIGHRDFSSLLLLCLAYAAVALIQGGLKLRLNIDRAAVSESATRHLRLRTRLVTAEKPAVEPPQSCEDGVQVAIVVSEVEPVGGFIGMSISEPLLHGGILLSVFGYLLYLQPWMALVCFVVFAPQFVFVPMMQATINRRTKSRIKIVREVSVGIVNGSEEERKNQAFATYVEHTDRIYAIDMRIFRLKFTMNFLMNLLHHLAIVGILFVGGWFVVEGRTEVGTVVAFISGLDSINEPWGDLVNYFREMTSARVKYRLIARVLGEDERDIVPKRLEQVLGSSD